MKSGKKNQWYRQKIPNISGLVQKTDYNTKITEIESKILSITVLATIAALTAVENKTPNVSNLVKKTGYDAKILDIWNKYIPADDYNKFTNGIVINKIKSEGLIDNPTLAGFITNADLNKK